MSLPLSPILHLAASEEGFLQQKSNIPHDLVESIHPRNVQESFPHVPGHDRLLETLLPPTDSN